MKRVVLCRPQGPRNVGMVLRVCDNFGPCELVLVAPERPALLEHPEFEQMSHGVEAVDTKLRVVDTLEEALAEATTVIGFTARVRDDLVRKSWNAVQVKLAELASFEHETVALVFGNEMFGLSVEEAHLCHDLVHVRTSADHTSLNLAIAVAVVLEGLFTDDPPRPPEPGGHPLTGAEREFLKANLKHAFMNHVAQNERAMEEIEASIERVFSRAPLETRDARIWHMMARALGSDRKPSDFGLDPSPSGRPRAQEP